MDNTTAKQTVYTVAYWARVDSETVMGVAEVTTSRPGCRPSWADCHRQIPGFVTGRKLS